MQATKRLAMLIHEHGLLHSSAELLELARPAIRIHSRRVGATDLPVGASKMGGLPDLPPGVDWPLYKGQPLALLAQFSMSEVSVNDAEGALPQTGMLYFFYDMLEQPWGYDQAHGKGWKVIYCNVEPRTLVRATLPLLAPDEYPLHVCELHFHPELTLPPTGSDEIEALGFNDESEQGAADSDNYWDLVNSGVIHRLLGYPAEEQGDIRWNAQLESNGVYARGPLDENDTQASALLSGISDWRLLFQMDDDTDGVQWFGGAGGRLFYSIRYQDLAERNFDNVWICFHWQ